MAQPPPDPKKLHHALVTGAPLPFEEGAVARARALATAAESGTAADVAALPEPLALAVIEAAQRARAIPLLTALADSAHKPLAKAAKKALYQLRSVGVAVPERAPREEARGPAPAPAREEPLPGLISSITGTGERALIIGRPVRGGVETLQLVIGDEAGVVHLSVAEISRGTFRKMLKEVRRPGAPTSTEIGFEEAKRVLAEAAGLNVRSRTPFPEGLDAALRHLGVSPAEAQEEVPAPEDGDAALAVSGARLHDEPEIAQWLPPMEEIQKLGLKAQEIATSSLYLDEGQRAQQLERTLESLAEAFFTPEARRLYGRRLWRMARIFEATARPAAAALARAEGRRLFHSAPGLFSPFARRLFEKVLALSGPKGAPREAETPAPPGGPQEPQGTRGEAERRSPGGLILP